MDLYEGVRAQGLHSSYMRWEWDERVFGISYLSLYFSLPHHLLLQDGPTYRLGSSLQPSLLDPTG